MDSVFIHANGRLTLNAGVDVTSAAHEYLFNPVELMPGATLGVVLELVHQSPVLRALFRQKDVDNLLLETLGAPPPYPLDSGIKPCDIEYAALYRCAHVEQAHDEQPPAVTGLNALSLQGVGFAATQDRYRGETLLVEKGGRQVFTLDQTAARLLVHLPLRLETEFVMTQEAEDPSEPNVEAIFTAPAPTLGEVLDAVVSELAWLGPASVRAAPCA